MAATYETAAGGKERERERELDDSEMANARN